MLVAGADDPVAMESVAAGRAAGLLEPVLIGARAVIERHAEAQGMSLNGVEIIDASGEQAMAQALIVRAAAADVQGVMKGQIHTDVFMAALLNKDAGMRTGQRFSHHFRMSRDGIDRALFITDAALNIAPDMKTKQAIMMHAVALATACGVARPKMALLSATESVSPQMPSSGEAAELAKWAQEALPNADVQGPLAFDNAVSPQSAAIKKITGPVAGDADILVVPSIETGNALFKALVYFLGACPAGIVMGARVPIVLTSRADDANARLASMALAAIVAATT